MSYIDEADLILTRARSANLDADKVQVPSAKMTALDYIRLVNEIKATLPKGLVLDWGCGLGQMSFLLQRRGYRVRSFDFGDHAYSGVSPVFQEVVVAYGEDSARLPYSDSAFDGVLVSGMLARVDDDVKSIAEVYRVLTCGGRMFVYNLPQGGRLKRKYNTSNAIHVLEQAGFRIENARRTGLLPHGISAPIIGTIYNWLASPLLLLDRLLADMPVINNFTRHLEIVAVKK